MLTVTEYNRLWTDIGGILPPPCYYRYLQREVYFHDYLDLFCCPKNESATFPRKIINGRYTVAIPVGNFNELANNEFTETCENGNVRLVVDHDFEFYNFLCKGRKLNYILIGEAPPPSGDYIYKEPTRGYATAILRAIGQEFDRNNRVGNLIGMANGGFLLVDLFPFAIDFNQHPQLRPNNMEIQLPNYANVLRRLYQIMVEKLSQLENCHHEKLNFCFAAPYVRTGIPFLNWLNNFNQASFYNIPTPHPLDLNGAPDFADAGGTIHIHHTDNPNVGNWPLNHVPKKARIVFTVGGQVPNSTLIRRVFNLP